MALAVAAGTIPVMVINDMVPDAYGVYYNLTGLVTTLGFLAAFALNTSIWCRQHRWGALRHGLRRGKGSSTHVLECCSMGDENGGKGRMRSFYSTFIGGGDLVFDIGANHGDHVGTFLSLGAIVVAVEPQPPCLDDLHRKFGHRADVIIVDAAVDRRTGSAVMHLSNNDTVSSLSTEWIARARAGGRFDDSSWEERLDVRTLTLDELIDTYGRPSFIKIDVEGSELRALEGLSAPVRALSFEYTPEDIGTAIRCVERLGTLGDYRYDLSPGETFVMNMGTFVGEDEIVNALTSIAAREKEPSGDVYAVLVDE